MRAFVYEKHGSPEVLELREIDKPSPKANEVLIRVEATSVNTADWIFLLGKPRMVRLASGLLRPRHKIPGRDVAGIVESVGKDVTEFHVGDEVFGESTKGGAFAEYVCVPEKGLMLKPANISFEAAAAVCLAGTAALQGLRDKAKVGVGKSVLINGASGAVGTFAVQIAKSFGAEVTAVCSTRNIDMVRSLGADHVVNYERENFTEGRHHYDIIFDAVLNHSLAECQRVLAPEGIFVSVAQPADTITGMIAYSMKLSRASLRGSQKFVLLSAKRTKKDLFVLQKMLEGKKITPVIDRTYKLMEVPDALRHVGEGHAQGKTVISMKD